MHNTQRLLLACCAVALSPTVSRAVPLSPALPPTTAQTVQLQVPNEVQIRPTLVGKISKPASIRCDEIAINVSLSPPGGFPTGGATATVSPAGSQGCTYQITVPANLLGKKVYLWGTFKKPSPLLSIQPVGWQSPISLPPQLGISPSYDFLAKETVIH